MKVGFYQAYWGRIGGGQRYTGLAAQLLAKTHDVEFVHHCADFDVTTVEEPLDLDLSGVRFRYFPRAERPANGGRNPFWAMRAERDWCREISEPYDVFINNSDSVPIFCHSRRGVLLTHFPMVTFEEFHSENTEEWRHRSAIRRKLTHAFHRREWRSRFGTYQLYLCNSNYGRKWMQRRWHADAEVVYPPLRNSYQPGRKENCILTIGAFHSSGHKKQDVTIQAFKRLSNGGLTDWKYRLIGSVGPTDRDRDYLASLKSLAEGYPIEFLTDIPGEELKSHLEHASLLWHAMGYGVSSESDPGYFEHFGMVATEAMAAGCIPIVFNGGGLPEIVNDGKDGYVWSTVDQLCDNTMRLISNPDLQKTLSGEAQTSCKRFSETAFEARLNEVLAPVLS